MKAVWRVVRAVLAAVLRVLRGRDLPLHAAAVTFYGGIAVVPAAVLAIRIAALVVGPERIADLTAAPIDAVPAVLGADKATRTLIDAGLDLGLAEAVAALIPATLYGEGLRRAFSSLGGSSAPVRAWRGRLLVMPLLAAGPGLLLGLLLVLPTAAGLLQRGGWASFGGIVVSFLVVWVALSAMLTWVYRVVGPTELPWRVSSVVGTATAANVSGFLHGFVLFWAIPLDLGLPFGGFDAVGAVVAVALWLYLLHTLALVGYVTAVELDARWTGRTVTRDVPGTPEPAVSGRRPAGA